MAVHRKLYFFAVVILGWLMSTMIPFAAVLDLIAWAVQIIEASTEDALGSPRPPVWPTGAWRSSIDPMVVRVRQRAKCALGR